MHLLPPRPCRTRQSAQPRSDRCPSAGPSRVRPGDPDPRPPDPAPAHAHLWKTPASRAARRTQPMSGTPARRLMFFSGMPLLPPRASTSAARCGGFSRPRPAPRLRCSFGGRPRDGRPRGAGTDVAAPFSSASIFLPRRRPNGSTSGSSAPPTPLGTARLLWQLKAPPTARPGPGARREL